MIQHFYDCGSGSLILILHPDPGLDLKLRYLYVEIVFFEYLLKIPIYLSIGPLKRSLKLQKKSSLCKENMQYLKCPFFGIILSLSDPDLQFEWGSG
jgi:hypothetical protein